LKSERKIVFILIFIVLAAVFHFYNERRVTEPDTGSMRVLEIVDGDTIVIDDGMKNRVR